MGVVIRPDSSFYWLHLERPHQKAVRKPTKIPVNAPTVEQRKLLRQQAEEVYLLEMEALVRANYELPSKTPTPTIRFTDYATWFETHVMPKRKGHVREAQLMLHLRRFFGDDDLAAVDRARVMEYETVRLAQRISGRAPVEGAPDTRRPVTAPTINREVDLL